MSINLFVSVFTLQFNLIGQFFWVIKQEEVVVATVSFFLKSVLIAFNF